MCVCVCVCVTVYIRHSQVRVHTSPLQLWLGKVNYRIVNHITRSPVNKTAFSSCFSLHFGNLIKSVFRLTNYFLTIWILTAIRSLLYTIHLHPLPTPDWWLPPGWYTLLHRLWGDCVIYSCDRLVGGYTAGACTTSEFPRINIWICYYYHIHHIFTYKVNIIYVFDLEQHDSYIQP